VTPGDELSLILDDELMADFPADVLTVHSSQWKSVQVDFGSLGFSTPLAARLCRALACVSYDGV
jgi:hypothetical protein